MQNEWVSSSKVGLHPIQKKTIDFINNIVVSEPDFNFSFYKVTLQELPDTIAYGQPNMPLSHEAQQYLNELDNLYLCQPLIALKLSSILVAWPIALSYYTQALNQAFINKMNDFLAMDSLPRKQCIEWGIYCWKNWPNQCSSREKFVAVLVQQLIQEAYLDPDYTLVKYDEITKRSGYDSYIFHMFEDAGHFLQFARLTKNQRPALILGGLERCLSEARRGYGDYHLTEESIRSIAKELFDISEENQYSALINHQIIYGNLIRYAYPDQEWYPVLFEKLWALECSKLITDERSVMNCFYIALNAPVGHPMIEVAQAYFHKWAFDYQKLIGDKPDALIKHAKNLIDSVNSACNEKYGMTRNKSIPPPENNILVSDTIDAYWQMVNWLQNHNPMLCFYVLTVGIEMDTFTVQQTQRIGVQAKKQLIEMFEFFCHKHIKDAVDLMVYMIRRSRFSTIDVHLYEVLNVIYPVFLSIDAESAKYALNIGTSIKGSHIEYWYPNKKLCR